MTRTKFALLQVCLMVAAALLGPAPAAAELSADDRALRARVLANAKAGTYVEADAKTLLERAYEYALRKDLGVADLLYMTAVGHLWNLDQQSRLSDKPLYTLALFHWGRNRHALLLEQPDYYTRYGTEWGDFFHVEGARSLADALSKGGLGAARIADARKSCASLLQDFATRGEKFPAEERRKRADVERSLAHAKKTCLGTPPPVVSSSQRATAPDTSNGAPVNLRMQGMYPSSAPVLNDLYQQLAEQIGTNSDGRIKVQALPTGAVAPVFALLESVGSNGPLQLAWVHPGYFAARNPAFALLGAVHFGADATSCVLWREQPETAAIADRLYGGYGVKALNCGATSAKTLWSRVPLTSANDLRGLRISARATHQKILTGAGATVVTLPMGEVHPALSRDVVTAAMGAGPFMDQALGLSEVARYAYYPTRLVSAFGIDLLVNQKAWDAAGAAGQQAIVRACKTLQLKIIQEADRVSAANIARFRAAGVTVAEPAPGLVTALRKSWELIATDAAAASPEYAALLKTLPRR